MSRIPQVFLDELLARTDLIEIIQNRITVKKAGINYKACCPFHQEKTPSFSVNPNKQFYYCFGCGAHGNAIGFLMAYDRLEFLDAVEQLANAAGMEVPRTQDNNAQQFQPLYDLMFKVLQFYQQQLSQHHIASSYLDKRGLSHDTQQTYALGFAPAGWDNLLNKLQQQNDLITTGMAINHPEKNRCYDRFRHRIMFPIRDVRGRVIAFGGRTLGDEQPKYLNSPETPIYHKSAELYGLYEARQQSKKLERLIVVEGYMDVVMLAQFGIHNAVATLGTAINTLHIQRLLRHVSNVIFCFDGDKAGRSAAWRALENTLPLMRDGLKVSFLFLPEGDDPDSFVKSHGTEQFLDKLNQATPLAKFFFQGLSPELELKTMSDKATLAQKAEEHLSKMPSGVFQQLMYDKLAEIVGVEPEKLKSLTQRKPLNDLPPQRKKSATLTKQQTRSPMRYAITLLLQQPALAQHARGICDLSQLSIPGATLLAELVDLATHNPHITTGALLEHWRERPELNHLAKLAADDLVAPQSGLEQEFQGALQRLAEQQRELDIQKLMALAGRNELNDEQKRTLQQLILDHH